MNYKFNLLNKCYLINNYINKYILCCFPNKEYVLKNEIDSCMYYNIKYIFKYQIYSNRLDILYDILVNVSMLDYYVYICFNKGIIKNKRYISVSNYLLEIKKIVYGLIKYEKNI